MIKTTTNYPLLISIFLFAVSLLLSYFFYKNPNLTKLKRYFLVAIKTVAFFLLLFLFLEPSFLTIEKYKPVYTNLILIDNSRSNDLPMSTDINKIEQIKKLLNNNWSNIKNIKMLSFSTGETKKIDPSYIDSINFNGFETNLNSALINLKSTFPDEYYNSVTVISDGNINAGPNPLYKLKEFNCPVYTFGIGDSIQQKDLVIDNVLYNKKAFTNIKNPIRVLISSYNLNNHTITVSLKREDAVIDTKNIAITRSSESSEIEFDVTESKSGTIKYSIITDQENGEITYKNNISTFLIDYLDNKENILYISSGPGYDNSYILDILKRTRNYNITTRILKNQNEFYEGTLDLNKLGEFSLLFLLGYPSPETNQEFFNNLISKCRNIHIPIVFLAQKNTDYKKIENNNDFFPFSISSKIGSENLVSIKSTNSELLKDILPDIDNAPQIFLNIHGIIPSAGSIVLSVDKSSGEPIIISKNSGNMKSVSFLGYGLWRWGLNEKTNETKFTEKFINGIINETVLKDKKEKLIVTPNKNIFDYTENIFVTAEVYDDDYNPLKNAIIKADLLEQDRIVKKGLTFELQNDKFNLTIPSLPVGDYILNAEADLNNNSYAKTSIRFLVDTLNNEYLVTKSNFDYLRTLSQNTGGQFYRSIDEFEKYKTDITTYSRVNSVQESSRDVKFNLWENRYALLSIILLLSIEWLVRKRNNVP